MNEAQIKQGQEYQAEFEADATTDERRKELLTWLQERAVEDGVLQTCIHCKRVVFYALWHGPLIQGHIYSPAGQQEYQITRLCEFCFDEITKEVPE